MTYKQSLKNIEKLMNLVMPLNCEYIYFDFSSDTEFKVICVEHIDHDVAHMLVREKEAARLPFAGIFVENGGFEMFCYYDVFGAWTYNLTTNVLDRFETQEKLRPKSSAQLKIDLERLVRKLKQS